MKIGFTISQRIFIVVAFFAIAVIGFMVKLPSCFRHIDKGLHSGFYFFAAVFLNVLLVKTKFVRHVVIFISLFVFGIAIEYAQAYSNKFFHNKIHGRFDPEDVHWNLKGLVAFSLLWIIGTGLILIYNKLKQKKEYI